MVNEEYETCNDSINYHVTEMLKDGLAATSLDMRFGSANADGVQNHDVCMFLISGTELINKLKRYLDGLAEFNRPD